MVKGLPERLRYMREKLSFSQRDVAKQLAVSPSLISGYETGERTPSVEVLLQLSYLYKCSVDYLLGKRREEHILVIPADRLTQSQINILRNLIDEFQEKN